MLKQNQDDQTVPAAERRVKKEEFAHAVAALEARRQAEARQKEGTVVIGDVLEQLQIALPAEEVLQEIQSRRAGELPEERPKRFYWDAERLASARLISGIILVPLATVILAAITFNPIQHSVIKESVGATRSGSEYVLAPPSLPQNVTEQQMDEGGFNASSVLKPLSAVPNEQPIHCNTESLNRLLYSPAGHIPGQPFSATQAASSNQLFDVRPGLHKPWILIKHEGRVYLRAWTSAKFTPQQAQQHFVTLHNSPEAFDAGVAPVKITLPLGFVNVNTSYSNVFGFQENALHVTNAQLDNHAWEDWKP